MKVVSHQLTSSFEAIPGSNAPNKNVNLVLMHGNSYILEEPELLKKFRDGFPSACIAGCSGAGEIINGEAHENSIVYTAIEFEHTLVRPARIKLVEGRDDEFEAGKDLAHQLAGDDLVAVILFSEGFSVDCDEVIRGVRDVMGPEAPFFGGLAGNSSSFEHTVVLDRNGVYDDSVVAIGLYGKTLEVNLATSVFNQKGIELDITSADSNIIYKINNQPALDVYEKLLSDPNVFELSQRLYFPLVILHPETRDTLYCRTIYEYDTQSKSLMAAGTVPEGPAKLINMTDCQTLLEDAMTTSQQLKNSPAEFAFVVSCAGRRGALGAEWKREVSLIQQNLQGIPNLGFYSYGEFAKSNYDNSTIVHNHTLIIATFHEIST